MIPYIVGHPIKNPADFYGRLSQVNRFYEVVAGTQAQSVSVLGVRRAGKTSFLHHVAHPDIMARYLPDPDRYLMVYLDMSSCPNPAVFYGRLCHRLQQLLGIAAPTVSPLTADVYQVELLLGQLANYRIILLLDEFDHLRLGSFGQEFLNELRSLTTHWEYEMACVTASYWDLFQLGTHVGLPPTSPFYNIFYPYPIYLGGLLPDELAALVCQPAERVGVALNKDDVAAVAWLAGTLPYFVQATAVSWLREKQAQNSVHLPHKLTQLSQEMAPFFAQWWRTLQPTEQALLQQVAIGAAPAEDGAARLRRYGLLRQEAGGETAVNGAIFTTWLQTQPQEPPSPPAVTPPNHPHNHRTLRQTLVNHFNLEELQLLCFDLGVDYDQLPGSTKGAKARDLILYWEQRGDLAQLVQAIRQERGAIL